MVNKNVMNFYCLIRVERQTHSLHHVHVHYFQLGLKISNEILWDNTDLAWTSQPFWMFIVIYIPNVKIKMENDYTLKMNIKEIRIEMLQWSIFLTRNMPVA